MMYTQVATNSRMKQDVSLRNNEELMKMIFYYANMKNEFCKEVGHWFTSTMGNVFADEGLSLPPVQKIWAFQQQGRGEHVARYRWQDVHSSTHLWSVYCKTNIT